MRAGRALLALVAAAAGCAGQNEPGADAAARDAAAAVSACTVPGPCNPFTGTGCGMGQYCRVGERNDVACADAVAGMMIAEGAVCPVNGACAPGLMCLGDADGLRCRKLCARGSRGTCRGDDRCGGTLPGQSCVQFCRAIPRRCDVYAQDCPTASDACSLAIDPESNEHYTGCRAAGPRGEDQPCDGTALCAKGLVCVASGAANRCVRVCRRDGPACPSGQSCRGTIGEWNLNYCE